VGRDNSGVVGALNELANALRGLDNREGAVLLYRDALARYGAANGKYAFNLVAIQGNLAETLDELGRPSEALPYADDCVRNVEVLPEDNPISIPCFTAMGNIRIHLGAARDAIPILERAVKIAKVRGLLVPQGKALFYLGEAVWTSKGDRLRARKLVAEGRVLLATDSDAAKDADAAARWLEEHRL